MEKPFSFFAKAPSIAGIHALARNRSGSPSVISRQWAPPEALEFNSKPLLRNGLLPPFLIFVRVEVVCILTILMLWLHLECSALYAMLYEHALPEVIAVLCPNAHRPPPSRDYRTGGSRARLAISWSHHIMT
jgi:hypothetical protein